ncbi:MAG: SGNH/GDSL hydrolase family protein [Corynebacteriales bacterium]|nr:SGNH/GDSL hydrolase family protein [Mycobacteriales bacterium]
MRALTRVAQARDIARKAMYGGSVLGAFGLGIGMVLAGQAAWLSRSIPRGILKPPPIGRKFGEGNPGTPIKLAILGDSSAAGLGAEIATETPGALIAAGLAKAVHRPVTLTNTAVVGAQSQHLYAQVEKTLPTKPDLAIIFIGGNDVIRRINPATATRHLAHAVTDLRAGGSEVIVCTCPDMTGMEPLHAPLRWLVKHWCREMATTQTVAVVSAGGRTVSLGDLLGEEFRLRPQELYALDRFHPNAQGYVLAAEVILPSALTALGYDDALAPRPSALWRTSSVPRQGVRGLRHAAAEAARSIGTEVAPAHEKAGVPGIWGELRNRLAALTEWVPTDLLHARLGGRGETTSPGEANQDREGLAPPLRSRGPS